MVASPMGSRVYSVSHSIQNCSCLMPPRSTSQVSRSWPVERSGRSGNCSRSSCSKWASRVRCSATRSSRWASSCARSPYDAPRIFTARSERSVTAGVGEPIHSASTRSPRARDGVAALGAARVAGAGRHPAVALHPPQHLVDLLVGGPPEEPDRPVEAPGQLDAGRGSLAQRDEERVFEGHASSLGVDASLVQLVAQVSRVTCQIPPGGIWSECHEQHLVVHGDQRDPALPHRLCDRRGARHGARRPGGAGATSPASRSRWRWPSSSATC